MIFEAAADVVKLALIVASLYFAFGVYVRLKQPTWSVPLEKRRLAILLVLVFAVFAIKVTEDALTGESGPIDRAILLFIRSHVPATMTGFFEAVSFTASSTVLFPLTTVAAIAFVLGKRRFEALLLVASVIGSALVVYVVKMAVGRDRPALWATDWYWGSSFPSGHTLVVAAFATAAAFCAGRLWPAVHEFTLSMAMLWTFLVALSRLVLGVHWPTDVLAAACVGACIPLAMSVAFELRHADRSA